MNLALTYNSTLTLLTHHPVNGSLTAFSMCLDDFFASEWNTPRLKKIAVWDGFRGVAKGIEVHPDETGDGEGWCVGWTDHGEVGVWGGTVMV